MRARAIPPPPLAPAPTAPTPERAARAEAVLPPDVNALREGGGYLVGGRFTVADLNVAEIIRYAQSTPELFTDTPRLRSWITACQSRPAFVAMMTERNAEPM